MTDDNPFDPEEPEVLPALTTDDAPSDAPEDADDIEADAADDEEDD